MRGGRAGFEPFHPLWPGQRADGGCSPAGRCPRAEIPPRGPICAPRWTGLLTGAPGTAAGVRLRGAAALTPAACAGDYLYVGTLDSPGSRYLVVIAAADPRDIPGPAQLAAWLRQIARLALPHG